MSRFQCIACGHIYDPADGDLLHGYLAGVQFAELPDTWTCPVCKIRKWNFTELQP